MLTKQQVNKLKDSGLKIKISMQTHKPEVYIKGRYHFDENTVYIYWKYKESFDDLKVTLYHELIHVRNDYCRFPAYMDLEERVEIEAKETEKKNPHLFYYIVDAFNIRYLKRIIANWEKALI